MKYTYSGNRVKTDIQLTIQQLNMNIDHLINQLSMEFNKNLSNGISSVDARKLMLDSVENSTGIYGSFSKSIKQQIRAMEKQLVAEPATLLGVQNKNQKFEWLLGSVKTVHCEDCLYLSGLPPKTIDEWRAEGYGLPREGKTKCNVGCLCTLLPVK